MTGNVSGFKKCPRCGQLSEHDLVKSWKMGEVSLLNCGNVATARKHGDDTSNETSGKALQERVFVGGNNVQYNVLTSEPPNVEIMRDRRNSFGFESLYLSGNSR